MADIISESSENYLEVIYELGMYNAPVRSTDVAKRMSVSKASVNKAVGVLREAGLVDQQLYGSINLTAEGKAQAKEVMQRHKMIREFFVEVLHVDYDLADKDACRIEHVVSKETMTLWAKYIKEILEQNNKG